MYTYSNHQWSESKLTADKAFVGGIGCSKVLNFRPDSDINQSLQNASCSIILESK